MLGKTELTYVAVGTVGVYAAHYLWNYRHPEKKADMSHMNELALYWAVGALAYFAVMRWYA